MGVRKYKQDYKEKAIIDSISYHRMRLREAIEAKGLDPNKSQWDLLKESPEDMGDIVRRDMAGEFGNQFPRGTFK